MTVERLGLFPAFSCCSAGSAAWFVALASVSLWLLSACTAESSSYPQCHVLVTAEDHYYCAYAAYDDGDYQSAILEFSEAIKAKPDYEYAITMRGLSYKHSHEYDNAIADFTEVLRLNPSQPIAYNNRGNAHRAKGESEQALADYGDAIRVEPSFADAYYNRALLLLDSSDLSGAIRDLSEAIRFYAEAANGPSPRISGWFNDARYGEPRRSGSKLRVIDEYLADAYYYRGLAYRRSGKKDLAKADFAAARAIDPSIDDRFVGAKD